MAGNKGDRAARAQDALKEEWRHKVTCGALIPGVLRCRGQRRRRGRRLRQKRSRPRFPGSEGIDRKM